MHSFQQRLGRYHPHLLWLLPILLAAAFLAGCRADVGADLSPADRSSAEAHVRSNIGTLSPRSPVLGGTFSVTAITWLDDDTIRVEFEDGHIALVGTADVSIGASGQVTLTPLRVTEATPPGGASSSSTSVSSSSVSSMSSTSFSSSAATSPAAGSAMSPGGTNSDVDAEASVAAGAGVGEFCGGIAGVACAAGLTCELDGTYPDAGGVCVR